MEPDRPRSLRRPPRPRYGWVVGLLAVAIIAYVGLARPRDDHATGLPTGDRLPPFAAPLATSALQGDVNVATRGGQGSAGARPACRVRGPGVLNSCQLAERGPVVLVFLATGSARCRDEVDLVQRIARRHPRIQVAAIAIRGDRGELRRTIARQHWTIPVAHDRDGALANLYGVAACPSLIFAGPAGRVTATVVGDQDAAQLERRFAALERTARRDAGT